MPIPDQIDLLCIAIRKRAEKEASKILTEAQKRHDHILETAFSKMERELEEEKLKLKRQTYQKAKRIKDAAELEARRIILSKREEIFLKTQELAQKAFLEIKTQKTLYKKLLEQMIQNAMNIISLKESKGMEIRCRKDDEKIVKEIIGKLPSKTLKLIKITPGHDSIKGGIICVSNDGKRLIDLSLNAILKQLEPEIRGLLAEKIFGGHLDE